MEPQMLLTDGVGEDGRRPKAVAYPTIPPMAPHHGHHYNAMGQSEVAPHNPTIPVNVTFLCLDGFGNTYAMVGGKWRPSEEYVIRKRAKPLLTDVVTEKAEDEESEVRKVLKESCTVM